MLTPSTGHGSEVDSCQRLDDSRERQRPAGLQHPMPHPASFFQILQIKGFSYGMKYTPCFKMYDQTVYFLLNGVFPQETGSLTSHGERSSLSSWLPWRPALMPLIRTHRCSCGSCPFLGDSVPLPLAPGGVSLNSPYHVALYFTRGRVQTMLFNRYADM